MLRWTYALEIDVRVSLEEAGATLMAMDSVIDK
jgi:hypothetical protein